MAFLQGIFMKCGGFLAVLAAMMMAGCGSSDRPESRAVESSGPSKPVLIGFSLGGVRMERWKKDEKYIELRAHELGAKVMGLSANDNADLQNSQAENLLMQGVDVLLVVPQNAEESSKIVEMAHQAGVKVIAYDRIIKNCALDYYVSFDNEKVGEYQARGVIQALDLTRTNHLIYIGGSPVDNNSQQLKKGSMRVLEPLIQSGKVVMELETFTDDWSLQKAYLDTQDFLRKGLPLHGVVAANDALAAGVLQALQEHGLAGIFIDGLQLVLNFFQRVMGFQFGCQQVIHDPADHGNLILRIVLTQWLCVIILCQAFQTLFPNMQPRAQTPAQFPENPQTDQDATQQAEDGQQE